MNKRMKGLCRKALALLLVCTLSFSMLQITAFADDVDTPSETFVGQDVDGTPSADNDNQWIPGTSGSEQANEQIGNFDKANETESNPVTPDSGVTPGPTETDPVTGSTTTTETKTDTWTNATPTPVPTTDPYGSPIPVPQPDPDAEPTPGITITGKQETTTTTTTDSQGRETDEKIEVSGSETVDSTTVKTETGELVTSGPEEVADEFITPKDDVTVTAKPGGSGTGTIGTVNMEELVEDKKTDALNNANRADDDDKNNFLESVKGYEEKEVPVVDKDGNPVLDDNGEPVLKTVYEKVETTDEATKTTTTERTSKVEQSETEDNSFTTTTTTETVTKEHTEAFRQPGDKPEYTGGTISRTDEFGNEIAGTTTGLQQNGNTFTTSEVVELKDEEGNVIGYTHTTYTTVYNEDGSENRTVTVETVQGESVTIDTTITETKVKTETTEVKKSDDQPDREVTVTLTMGKDNSNTTESGWHYVGPDASTTKTNSNDLEGDSKTPSAPTKWVDSNKNNKEDEGERVELPYGEYWYNGTWYKSELDIYTKLTGTDTNQYMDKNHSPNLKLLVRKDPTTGALSYYYAYCTDLGMNIYNTEGYEEVSMDQLAETGVYSGNTISQGNTQTDGKKNAEAVSAIAMLGYWGAKEGTGSLADFKTMLSGIEGIDTSKITDGIALTATQAAIWYFGNSANKTGPYDDNLQMTDENADKLFGTDAGEKGDLAYKIYKYLTNPSNLTSALQNKALKANEKKDTYAVTSKKVTGATTTLKSTQDATTGKIDYTADIAIGISVKQSQLRSNDLAFHVTSGGKTYVYYLDGRDGKVTYDETTGTYTIKDVAVGFDAEGKADVSFQVQGNQSLTEAQTVGFLHQNNDTGAYSLASQAFVGVKETNYNHSVDFSFNLGFSISDAIVNIINQVQEVTTTETHTERTWNTQRETATNYESYPRYVSPTPTPTEEPTPAPTDEPTPAPTATPGPEEEIPDEPDTPLGPGPDEPDEPIDDPETPLGTPEPDVPDEPEEDLPEPDVPKAPAEPDEPLDEPDVPLADVPKTGDESMLWYAIAMLSGCGLAVLALTGRKKKEEEI